MNNVQNAIKVKFSSEMPETNLLLQAKNIYLEGLQLLESAVLEKRNLLARKLLKIRKSARRNGIKSGLKKAENVVNDLLETAKRQYSKNLLQSNKDCLELALKIASEILQAEVSYNTESLSNRIKNALSKLSNTESLVIIANEIHCDELASIFNSYPKKVQIQASEAIPPGNAKIETAQGEINLNWVTQLEIMRRLLLSKIQSRLC